MNGNDACFEKDYVERGFRRCEGLGVDRGRKFSSRILEGEALAGRLERNRDLIVTAQPFIERLHGFVRGSGFFAILTDAEGCILALVGDEGLLSEAYALRMVPGAFMDEASIGTNAMGTALAEGRPVQVSGEEHFIEAYHRWTCSGAPIRDAEGVVIGSLDLTGNHSDVHLHTLGMVVAAVHAIEQALVLNARNAALARSKRFSETLIDSITAGIVSADLEGRVLSVNRQALEQFCMTKEALELRGIPAILPAWPEVREAALSGRELQNRDLPVDSPSPRPYFNLASYPILDESGRPWAVILVFKDVKKVRKHAHEIMGHRALYTFDKIVGASKSLREAVDFARKVADSSSTILITGESGTGKEIFAQAIQNASQRRDEPFVVLNCGAIPRTLIESELFGYAEGAFTGARKGGQAGKFEIADGGTIFLDEIGEMPLDMQTRLLRVIEEGVVTRVGESRAIPVDVRIIAATNADLEREVARGNFRMDLFYRLNVLPIRIPPLRERRDDIPLLVRFYMDKISRKLNRRPVPISAEDMECLAGKDWPGNVRELENFIELVINAERLPGLAVFGGQALAPEAGGSRPAPSGMPSLEEAERDLILRTLAECGDNVTLAARKLGIGRNTIYRRLAGPGTGPGAASDRASTPRRGRPKSGRSNLEQCSTVEQPIS